MVRRFANTNIIDPSISMEHDQGVDPKELEGVFL